MSVIPTTAKTAFQRFFVPAFWHCAGIAAGLAVGLILGAVLGGAAILAAMA